MLCTMWQSETGRRKSSCSCRERTLALQYLKGKEASVAATPYLVHLWAGAKEESVGLGNEEPVSSDTTSAELRFFLPGNLLVSLRN